MAVLSLPLIAAQDAQKKQLLRQTGIDNGQLNNWFINQRKRHWNGNKLDPQATVGGPPLCSLRHPRRS